MTQKLPPLRRATALAGLLGALLAAGCATATTGPVQSTGDAFVPPMVTPKAAPADMGRPMAVAEGDVTQPSAREIAGGLVRRSDAKPAGLLRTRARAVSHSTTKPGSETTQAQVEDPASDE